MISTSYVIETKGLNKRFKEVHAVNNLTMRVKKGEIYGFLGPNGAGKSTTIKMLTGLMHPTSGSAYINGIKVNDGSVDVRKDIGFLPERASFYDNLTPIQTLEFFCELKGVDKSVVPGLIKEVGLESAANRKVGTFSKGMTQLVGVAQAMIGNPSIYIMDEPMGGLDARWVKMVRDKILDLNKQGATIIISSHILKEIQSVAHRVGIIDNGVLVAEDTIENISEKLHLKPKLWINIPGLNGKIPDGLDSLPGVEGSQADGDNLWVTCDSKMKIKVISTLEAKGYQIENFQTMEPSLEDAFVQLVTKREGI